MPNINKPNMTRAWANNGAVVPPSNAKIDEGWTAEKPPFQNENWVQNRTDVYIQHLDERGCPEWDALVIYSVGSRVYFQNQQWHSLQNSNLGSSPVAGAGQWIPVHELQNPIGIISAYAGSGSPNGWLICDGSALNASVNLEFQRLFDFIGNSFGGIDNTDFALPNLVGRVPVGVGASGLVSLGDIIGSQNVNLSVANMPSHNHSGSSGSAGAHAHKMIRNPLDAGGSGSYVKWSSHGPDERHYRGATHPGGYNNDGDVNSNTVPDHSHTVSIGNTGSGSAVNNMQPSLGINWIIKY